MAYDNPNRIKYVFPVLDFGAGADTFAVTGPKGKTGRIYDYGVEHITEAFTDDTLPAYVSVGSSSDADLYGDELGLGESAVNAGTVSLRTTYTAHGAEIGGGGVGTVLLDPTVPADTAIFLHCTSPTGGTPAGIATPFMVIDWDN